MWFECVSISILRIIIVQWTILLLFVLYPQVIALSVCPSIYGFWVRFPCPIYLFSLRYIPCISYITFNFIITFINIIYKSGNIVFCVLNNKFYTRVIINDEDCSRNEQCSLNQITDFYLFFTAFLFPFFFSSVNTVCLS